MNPYENPTKEIKEIKMTEMKLTSSAPISNEYFNVYLNLNK